MRDANKTIGNMIDKVSVSIISSVDEDGFPNSKAMLPPRKREGIKQVFFTTNTSSMREGNISITRKPAYISLIEDFSRAICLRARWKSCKIALQKK